MQKLKSLALAVAGVAALSFAAAAVAQKVAEARDGRCRLTVEGAGEIFTVRAEGLEPGETVEVESVSEGERMTGTQVAGADGTFGLTLFPAVRGKSAGTATFSVRASRCRLSVSYPWRQ